MSLVVLAAGLGSRFGGTKQLAEVGPAGEAILDYTVSDARRAGLSDIVLVIRRDLEELVSAHLRRFHGPDLAVRMVYQDELGPPRAKPWGTGHAVLAAAGAVDGPFAVVNADDFYGRAPIEQLAAALRRDDPPGTHYLMAYELAQTLSASGTVSRGVCRAGPGGVLRSIVENLAIARDGDGRIVSRDSGRQLAEDTPVSLNLWGLRPAMLAELAQAWEQFQAERGGDPAAEFQLPTVIDGAIAAGRATVLVEQTGAEWMGVTYPDDLAHVRRRIAELVQDGTYPCPIGPA
jgi:choline kinase